MVSFMTLLEKGLYFYNVAVKRIRAPHYFILDKLFNSKAIHEVKILSIEIYFFDSNDNVFLFSVDLLPTESLFSE